MQIPEIFLKKHFFNCLNFKTRQHPPSFQMNDQHNKNWKSLNFIHIFELEVNNFEIFYCILYKRNLYFAKYRVGIFRKTKV